MDKPNPTLRWLFLIHAIVTVAAGVVLIAAPALIPTTIGIRMERNAYLVCYLLGSAELALAFLSYSSRTLTDRKSLRLIVSTFMMFHASTAAVEGYALWQGASTKLWGNVALRLLILVLFWYYGLRRRATGNAAAA